jgi:hypothetical protein
MIRLTFLLLFLLLSGCIGNEHTGRSVGIWGNRYSTHELQGRETGNIVLISSRKIFEGDVTYRAFEKRTAEYLIKNNLRVVQDEKDAKYAGFINYGFNSPSIPVVPYNVEVNKKSIYFEIDNYDLNNPKRRLTQLGQFTGSTYDRVFEFRLFDLTTSPKPKQILNVRLVSEGQCNILSELVDDLVTMTFENFPPKNNQKETITIGELRLNSC